MALSERLAIIITANGSGAISEFKSIERSASRSVGKAQTAGEKFKANAARIGAGMVIVGAAVGAVMKSAVTEADQAAVVGRQTAAVIESTGGVAGVTAVHLESLAGALSKVAAVDDEVIQSAGNVLLTFKAVRNEVGAGNNVYDRAVTSALDLSAALGTDLQGATIQLGKALANPVQGITALRRAGVDFTSQQRDQIAAMVAVGDTLGAQKIIMEEVESQFGGQAEATATGMDKLSVGWGNLMEAIGTPIVDSGIIDWWAANWEDPMARLGAAWDEVERGFGGAPLEIEFDGETLSLMAEQLGIGKIAGEGFGAEMKNVSTIVEELNDAISEYLSFTFDIPEAQREAGESFASMREALTSTEPNWGTQAEAMQDYVESVAGVVQAQSEQGASQAAVDATITTSIQNLRGMRDAGVITGAQFVTLRDQILGIPAGAESKVTTPGARESIADVDSLGLKLRSTGKARAAPRVEVITERVAFDRLVRDLESSDGRRFAMQVSVGASGPLSGRAAGGPVEAGQAYLVGEKGPELAVFGESGTVIPAGPTKALMSGGSGVSGSATAASGGGVTVIVQGNVYGVADLARELDDANRKYNTARTAA